MESVGIGVLVFAAALAAAELLSRLFHRTMLSSSVLFLAAGIVAGPHVTGLIAWKVADARVGLVADLALFAVLWSDGMRSGVRDLLRAWQLPGRALLLGMPLTALAIAAAAHSLIGVDWRHAGLAAAALSPTDPVFAAAIVGRPEIPFRLRHLLNVESGLNDGLALPFVMGFLAASTTAARGGGLTGPLALVAGIALGIALSWGLARLESTRLFAVTPGEEPLFVFAIGLLVLATAATLRCNEFLAAFCGGITVASVAPRLRDAFQRFGEQIAELLKLAALLLLGALLSPPQLAALGGRGLLFAAIVLLVSRPAALMLVLLGSELGWRERATAAWFGPKGFASVVYGLLILRHGSEDDAIVFQLVALVVTLSIVAHSSTDVPVAKMFRRAAERAESRGAS